MKKAPALFAVLLALLVLTGCGPMPELLRGLFGGDEPAFEPWVPPRHEGEAPNPDTEPLHYGYGMLDEEGRRLYDELLGGIGAHMPIFAITPAAPSELLRVYTLLLYDQPGLFWVDLEAGCRYLEEEGLVLSIQPVYRYGKAEREEWQARLDARTEEILASAPQNAPIYGQMKYLHDTIVQNCEYDRAAENGQTLLGPLLDGRSVCTGYTLAFKYLCDKLGIPCLCLQGQSLNEEDVWENHVWNMVQIGGDYYHVDVTWADPLKNPLGPDYVSYGYFNVMTADLAETHMLADLIPLPLAAARTYNYHYYEGLYYYSYEEAVRALPGLFYHAAQNGWQQLSIRFETAQALRDAAAIEHDFAEVRQLVNEAGGAQLGRVRFSLQEETRTLLFLIEYEEDI